MKKREKTQWKNPDRKTNTMYNGPATYEETVIICSTDYYAVEVYRKNSNVKVVGFDNISILDKYNLPIDSVGYSVSEIAQGVLNIIKNKKSDTIEVDYFINER